MITEAIARVDKTSAANVAAEILVLLEVLGVSPPTLGEVVELMFGSGSVIAGLVTFLCSRNS